MLLVLVVKFLVGLGHVEEQLAGGEGGAVGLLKPPHVVHQLLGAHRVAVPAQYTSQCKRINVGSGSNILMQLGSGSRILKSILF